MTTRGKREIAAGETPWWAARLRTSKHTPRKLSRSAHPELWQQLITFRRLRRATQRMAAFGGYERVRVSKLMRKLRASGVMFGQEAGASPAPVTPVREPSYDAGIVQKGKNLFKRVADALRPTKKGDR